MSVPISTFSAMHEEWVEPLARDTARRGFTEEQLKRARQFAGLDHRSTRERVTARLGLGDVCAEIVHGSQEAAHSALLPLAQELGYAVGTLVNYCRTSSTMPASLRDRIEGTSVAVPWSALVDCCSADDDDRKRRVKVLLELLDEAERRGAALLNRDTYRERIGNAGHSESITPSLVVAQLARPDVQKAVVAHIASDAAVTKALVSSGAVRELLRADPQLADVVRSALQTRQERAAEAVRQLTGPEEEDPRAAWAVRFFDQVHKSSRVVLEFPPEEFSDIDDPDVWDSIEMLRDSVNDWTERVLQVRPRSIRLVQSEETA